MPVFARLGITEEQRKEKLVRKYHEDRVEMLRGLSKSFQIKSGVASQQRSGSSARKETFGPVRALHHASKNTVWNIKPKIDVSKQYFHTTTKLQTPQPTPMAQLSESFLDGNSANYVEQMLDAWKRDPSSVHASWAAYFSMVEKGVNPGQAYQAPPNLHGATGVVIPPAKSSSVGSADNNTLNITESMRVLLLVRAYQVRGHVLAKLDPLGLTTNPLPPELMLSTYGFTEADLDREFYLGDNIVSGFLSQNR
jgi:hypothetical protein